MEGDIVQMGAYIGAGLACTGMGGAAVGVGHVVGNFLSGALRNPSAAAGQTATMFIGIAFCGSAGDLLVPRRASADVRGLRHFAILTLGMPADAGARLSDKGLRRSLWRQKHKRSGSALPACRNWTFPRSRTRFSGSWSR